MTKDKHSRRSFFRRIASGLPLLAVPVWNAVAGGFNNLWNDHHNHQNDNEMNNDPILGMAALGFQWETYDPFLFCVHHEDYYPSGDEHYGPGAAALKGRNLGQDFVVRDGWRMYHGRTVPGFPVHPHRGFETVTIVRQGFVDHADSLGAAGRYSSGDVQWMTAGKGVQHAEMFPLLDKESANTLELFQIWLNLPASRKFADPSYIMFWNGDTPISDIRDANDKLTSVTIIAGKLNVSQAPAPPPDSWAAGQENSVAIWSLKMEAGAKWTLPAAEPGLNRTLYFFRGDALQVAGKEIKPYHSVRLRSDLPALIECAGGSCELLLLQGRPIGEAVVQYGPFVMNTRAEIEEAFSDYRRTSFGGWPWPTDDPVHGNEKARFARFADGKMEKPED